MGKSTSELGHAKNADNFAKFIKILEEMGPLYNPAVNEIKLKFLKEKKVQLTANQEDFRTVNPLFKAAVAERAELYEPLSRLGTRILNAFKAYRFSEENTNNMISLNKKLRGQRIIKLKKDKPEGEEAKTISTAQLSYDNKANTFADMIGYCKANPLYVPNEADLQIAGLKKYYDELMKSNDRASVTGAKLLTARNNRDVLLYEDKNNILDLVRAAKDYLKSLDGAKSYYSEAVKLKFKNKSS